MGGGRDGSWLMCRQRRSLLCVSEAHKAAPVCAGTERPPFTLHDYFLSALCVAFRSCRPSPCYRAALGEPSSLQCGDATSFSSHYVLIRGCYRGGGEDQKQTGMRRRSAHTIATRPRRDEACPSAASLKATLKLLAYFPFGRPGCKEKKKKKKRCNNWELLLFVAMSTEICKHLAQRWTRSRSAILKVLLLFFLRGNRAFMKSAQGKISLTPNTHIAGFILKYIFKKIE